MGGLGGNAGRVDGRHGIRGIREETNRANIPAAFFSFSPRTYSKIKCDEFMNERWWHLLLRVLHLRVLVPLELVRSLVLQVRFPQVPSFETSIFPIFKVGFDVGSWSWLSISQQKNTRCLSTLSSNTRIGNHCLLRFHLGEHLTTTDWQEQLLIRIVFIMTTWKALPSSPIGSINKCRSNYYPTFPHHPYPTLHHRNSRSSPPSAEPAQRTPS